MKKPRISQPDLFGTGQNAYGERTNPKTLARASHPSTSHKAAQEVAGSVAGRAWWVAECVRATPGLTGKELAARHCPKEFDPNNLTRRLSDAAKRGWIKRGPQKTCGVTGATALTWLPVE